MRVFVAGATGVVGRVLVPMLVGAGHEVVGTTRSADKVDALAAQGAKGVAVDALDVVALGAAVVAAEPEVVVHQLTALSGPSDLKRFDAGFAATNRLRTAGTDALLAAAREVDARRFVAQSFAGWPYARSGGPVKSEDDPLDPSPPAPAVQTLAAIRHLEAAVTGAPTHAGEVGGLAGIVLRFGILYGPGTSLGAGGDLVELVRRRKMPVVGGGSGVFSFCHVVDAARASALAVEGGDMGIYNIVDDEPAPVSEWLPYLATVLGAKAPRRLPAWLASPLIGAQGVSMMTAVRGASNAKARRLLGFIPSYGTWRDGFRTGLG